MVYLLKHATVIPEPGRVIEGGSVLIAGGRLAAVGDERLPVAAVDEEPVEIDLAGKFVLPGFIDAHTHLGIIEEATGRIGVDNNENSEPVTPHLRAIDAVNPNDIAFHDAVAAGITAVMTGPGSTNPVGGQSIAIKTSGVVIDQMVLANPVGLKLALGENPLTTYGRKDRMPVTRLAIAALIRDLFMQAQDYLAAEESGAQLKRDIRLEAVLPALRREIPLRIHAHRADDIVTAVRIAEEFGMDLIIEHGTEGHLVKDYLAEKRVPVAVGPMLTPRIKMELKNRSYRTPRELVEAGVKIAIITDHPYNSIEYLRIVTILAVKEGLPEDAALRALTVHPAEMLRLDGRIGRLAPGLDADLVVFDGPPLKFESNVSLVFQNGEIVYRRESAARTVL